MSVTISLISNCSCRPRRKTAGEPEFKAGKVLRGGDLTLGLEVEHGLASHRRAKGFLN